MLLDLNKGAVELLFILFYKEATLFTNVWSVGIPYRALLEDFTEFYCVSISRHIKESDVIL